MITKVDAISSLEFNKGLVTRSDFLKGDINASPNTMDVQWQFDASLHKRFGASSTNSISLGITNTAGWIIDTNSSLTTGLKAYWKLDEAGGTRADQLSASDLKDINTVLSATGILNKAAYFIQSSSQALSSLTNQSLSIATNPNSNLSISTWVYYNDTLPAGSTKAIVHKGHVSDADFEYEVSLTTSRLFTFGIGSSGSGQQLTVTANSFGVMNTATWYNIIAWFSNNSHIGISVNLSVDTAAMSLSGIFYGGGSGTFGVGARVRTNNTIVGGGQNALIDETSVWGKILSTQERIDLFNSGSANSFTAIASGAGWAMFDFGATSLRWLTIATGTGLTASSNLGVSFINIGSTRTQSYQYIDRSKNVAIFTSDAYDPTLYWAGSIGTFAATVAPNSAPNAKFSINYQGFLNLLNFQDSNGTLRKRGFAYQDENTQLSGQWNNSFDLPSSADDEITAPFVLYKFLYVSTRYRLFRLAYVGGNPDWSFLQIKTWGYVPRTVKVVTLQNGGQVAIGMDWDRRIRMFDGFDDRIISDNVENNNGLCDFALQKISYAGSGLIVSHAEYNSITQEYRLNVAIGANSIQTTHAIVLNLRNLAFYPYSNQNWQAMCIAESNNQRHLMAIDRSGFVSILDSGNLDNSTPINDVYDSPPLFSTLPEKVSKGKELDLFFGPASCGTIYLQDRVDLSNQWSAMRPLTDKFGTAQMTGTEPFIKLQRTITTPNMYNTYQFRITSSANTANPWQLDRLDFIQQGFGIGRGNG